MAILSIQTNRLHTFSLADLDASGLSGSPATVLTVSTIPTIGSIYKDGVAMIVSDTITVQEILDGKLTFISPTSTLGEVDVGFDSDTYTADITLILGDIGKLFIIAKVKPPTLTISDSLPREVPAVIGSVLAYEIAARLLETGIRKSDLEKAAQARAVYNDAYIDTVSDINQFGGSFDSLEPK